MECITVNAVNNDRLDDGNTITLSISHSEIADAEMEVFDDESKPVASYSQIAWGMLSCVQARTRLHG